MTESKGGSRSRNPRKARRFGAVPLIAAIGLEFSAGLAQVPFTPTPYQEHAFVEEAMRFGVAGKEALKAENRLQTLDGVAAFVTRDSLQLSILGQECTLLMCGGECMARPRFGWTALALPGPREAGPPVFGLVRVENKDNQTSVTAVVVRDGTTLQQMEINLVRTSGFTLKGTLVRERTYVPPGIGQGVFSAIAALRKPEDQAGRGFLALGTQGLARRVRETTGGALSDISIQAGTLAGFTACGQGWAGTAQGQIFSYHEEGLSMPRMVLRHQLSPSAQAIDRIDSLTAMTSTGMALVRRGEKWLGIGGGSTPYVGAYPRFSLSGTHLVLFSAPGDPPRPAIKEQSLGDDVSYLVRKASQVSWSKPERNIVFEGSLPEEMTLAFRDADENAAAPLFRLRRAAVPGAEDLSSGFVQADPALGCAATGHCLPGFGTPARLLLQPDSVILAFTAITGTRGNSNCNQVPFFTKRDTTFRLAAAWTRGDDFTLAIGMDTVTFSHGVPSRVLTDKMRDKTRNARPGKAGTGIGAATVWRNGWHFDLAGRQIIPDLP